MAFPKTTWADGDTWDGAAVNDLEARAAMAPETAWLGLNGNMVAGYGTLSQWASGGISLHRDEITQPADAPLSDIATWLANGITRVVFVIELSNYGTNATFPTSQGTLDAFATYFVSVVQAIEAAYPNAGFMYEITNESWGSWFWGTPATAATYAALVLTVLNACDAAGLDLSRIYPMVQDQSWPAAMISAESTLADLIQGWSIHPYGVPPPGYAQNTTQGIASVPYFREQILVGNLPGASNILISEIGLRDRTVDGAANPTDDSVAVTAAQATLYTQQILQAASRMHEAGWLTALLWYSRNDGGWATNAAGGALTNIGIALSQFPQAIQQYVTSVYSPESDDGYFAVSMEPMSARDAVQLTSGKLYLFRVRLDRRLWAQALPTYIDTGGSSLTTGQCVACIYNEVGSLQVTSSDQSTNWTSTGRMVNSCSGTNFKPGTYWIGLLAVGGITPKFRGALVADQANFGWGGSLPARSMVSVSSYTAPPSTISLSAGGAGGVVRASSSVLVALSA